MVPAQCPGSLLKLMPSSYNTSPCRPRRRSPPTECVPQRKVSVLLRRIVRILHPTLAPHYRSHVLTLNPCAQSFYAMSRVTEPPSLAIKQYTCVRKRCKSYNTLSHRPSCRTRPVQVGFNRRIPSHSPASIVREDNAPPHAFRKRIADLNKSPWQNHES